MSDDQASKEMPTMPGTETQEKSEPRSNDERDSDNYDSGDDSEGGAYESGDGDEDDGDEVDGAGDVEDEEMVRRMLQMKLNAGQKKELPKVTKPNTDHDSFQRSRILRWQAQDHTSLWDLGVLGIFKIATNLNHLLFIHFWFLVSPHRRRNSFCDRGAGIILHKSYSFLQFATRSGRNRLHK